MNELTDERRNQLKIGVILLLVLFLFGYGWFMYSQYLKTSHTDIDSSNEEGVVFTQPKLQFFKYTVTLNEYPDRITIHYPYLIIVRPDQTQSEIYNMQTRKKEMVIQEVLLDYDKGNVVYNKQGFETYFNKTDLGVLCDSAFIQSSTQILCITRPDQNKSENKLISINPQDKSQKDLYSSQYVLTAISVYKNDTYLGEYDFIAKRAFITVNGKSREIGDLVNIMYPMGNGMYAGSFKSLRNSYTASYYLLVRMQKSVTAKKVGEKKIVLIE